MKNIIHIYLESLICQDSELERYQCLLTDAELARARRLIHESDQRKLIVAKGKTREILSQRLGCLPKEVEFEFGEKGKPFVKNQLIHFNVSHSGDYLLVAVSQVNLGVDIEQVRTTYDSGLSKRFLTKKEDEAIESGQDFFQLWTCKEAFIKATGLGLSFGLSRFEIDIKAEKSFLMSIDHDECAAKKWTVMPILLPIPGYCAALAVESAWDEVEVVK